DQVGLAVEVGDPEAVDDVRGAEVELDGPADGDVDFVGRGEDVARRGVLVLQLPPPLVAGHLDRQVGAAGPGVDGPGGHEVGDQEDEEDAGRQDHRPGHRQRQPAVLGGGRGGDRLVGRLPAAAAEDGRQDDQHYQQV